MSKQSTLIRALAALAVGLGCAFAVPRAAAQSGAVRERPKWKPSAEARQRMEARRRRTPPEATRRAFEQIVTVQQAAAIYERIFSDVNRRYVIGYQPTNKERDGGRQRVVVEVRDHPEYTVWGRKFYYAPGPHE